MAAAALALLAFMLYASAWQPLSKNLARLRANTQDQRRTLTWMKQAAADVKRLRATAPRPAGKTANQPLLTVVDQTARDTSLRDAIHRLEPQGREQVQLWFEKAPFDALIQWLADLRSNHGISVINISIQRQPQSGTVNAHLLLRQNGGK